MATKKRKKSNNRTKKSSSAYSHISGNMFLVLLGSFILLGFFLMFVNKINNTKKYDPVLEKKLDMKTIPQDVKKQISILSPSASFRVPVLMYHYVEYVKDPKDTIRQSLATSPLTFESQIKTLKDGGYTFITAGQLGDVLDGTSVLPPKPVVLTFDDGYGDFYTDVFPLLKKYKVKATAYIVPGFLGGANWMEPDQVQEIADSGLVEIGAHTVDHTYLKGIASSVVLKEVDKSKIMLQDEFGVPVVSFAYPYGAFDLQAINIVKKSGFKTAVATIPGIGVSQTDRFFIQRIRPGARTGESLTTFLDNYQPPADYSTPSE